MKRNNNFEIFNIKKKSKVDESPTDLLQPSTSRAATASSFDDQICYSIINFDSKLVEPDDLPAISNDLIVISRQTGGTKSHYNFNLKNQISNKTFGVTQSVYDIETNETLPMSFAEAIQSLNAFFKQVHQKFVVPLKKNDRIQIMFNHDAFTYPVYVGFLFRDQMTTEIMKNQFENTCQSYKHRSENEIQKKHQFTASICVAEVPKGSRPIKSLKKKQGAYEKVNTRKTRTVEAHEPPVISDFDDYIRHKNCIVNINNNDNFCLIYSVLIGQAYWDKHPLKGNYAANCNLLKTQVHKIAKHLDLDPDVELGISEIKRIETYLKEYQIMVLDWEKSKSIPIYLNTNAEFNKYIYVLLYKNHFYAIKSIAAFYECNRYCHACKHQYSKNGWHKCPAVCKLCERIICVEDKNNDQRFNCSVCKKKCLNIKCKNRHEEYVCSLKKLCEVCGRVKLNPHVCGDDSKWCGNCKESVPLDHKCYILTEDQVALRDVNKAEEKFDGFIFFDYETYLNDEKIHIPNLIMAKKICVNCIDRTEECNECIKMFCFTENNEFCKWLILHKHFIAIAHNLKGFDGSFIIRYCMRSVCPNDSFPGLLVNGTKVLSIKFRELKIIDSYSFIPSSLDSFTKTFDLTAVKGYFPHTFNTIANTNYIGPIPAREHYCSDFFSKEKKIKFDLWYDSQCDKTFNMYEEIRKYCWSDVLLLARGCMKFRTNIMNFTKRPNDIEGICPFRNAVTIASLSNLIYRRNSLKENQIAIIPENGYNKEQRTSMPAH